MPRILVADDNSNIHRTIAQALKEAGVDVVAVGNGEAAVRKIAEIKPDLVLADIFMPVRNGYEVCEFVKKDPNFSHIPVVLLIGAFDPFDEREAQRVQADAILKKPFVPADSLLRTVSDLLAQTASRSPATPAAASPAPASRPAAPAPAVRAPATEYMDQAPEEIAPAKARLEWDSNEQPLAFGTLLENPAAEAAGDDTVVTARRDPNLGEPAFWAPTPKAEPEANEGESEGSDSKTVDEEQWSTGTELVELDDLDKLPAETKSVSDAAVPESPSDLDEAALELPELELPELTLPIERSEEKPSETSRSTTPAAPEAALLKLAQPEDDDIPELDSFPVPAIKAEAPQTSASTSKTSVSEAKLDWGMPADPAKKIADEPELVQEPGSESSEDEAHRTEAEPPGLATLAPFLASLTSAASARDANAKESFDFDAIRQLSAEVEHEVECSEDVSESESAEAAGPPEAWRLDPTLVEAIAQRVIERMQPQLIELVTRELLRPAVEALVQRELERK